MQYVILAGGPETFVPNHKAFHDKNIQWIGVDRGTYHLLKREITPIHAFGDFDSVSSEEKSWMEAHGVVMSSFSSEKDNTDLELAIDWVIERKPESIIILGATGGRLDHSLINIQLLLKGLDAGVNIVIIDKQNMIMMKKPGRYTIQRDNEYKYLSFLPFSSRITRLSISGVKYPLKDATLLWGDSLCISNEIIAKEASYSFDDGTIIVIRSHD